MSDKELTKNMKIGFTGTQVGMSDLQKESLRKVLVDLKATEFHHGDCIGADAEAASIARDLGIPIVIHPPVNPSKRAFTAQPGDVVMPEYEYLVRNRHIVDASDVLIAAPKTMREELRSGTWSTLRYAQRTGTSNLVLER